MLKFYSIVTEILYTKYSWKQQNTKYRFECQLHNTVECHYTLVQYNIILHMVQQ